MSWERILPRLLGALILAGLAGAIAVAVVATTTLPDGPVDVVWDKAACAHCSMHVGEPPFAAQLTTRSGQTLVFDDPGCLFEFVAAAGPEVHAIWFHHVFEDRWLHHTAVGFVTATSTPMGYGLGAVDPGTPAAIDLDAARERCLGGPPVTPAGHR
jgi:hypothetical protein